MKSEVNNVIINADVLHDISVELFHNQLVLIIATGNTAIIIILPFPGKPCTVSAGLHCRSGHVSAVLSVRF